MPNNVIVFYYKFHIAFLLNLDIIKALVKYNEKEGDWYGYHKNNI